MRWKIVSALFFVGLVSGCAQTENFHVSSQVASQENNSYKRFTIVSSGYKQVENNITFSEFARQTAQVLIQKGYVFVNNPRDAQVLVALSYHIGQPQRQVGYSRILEPIYPDYYLYESPYWNDPVYNTIAYQFTTYQKTLRLQAIDAVSYNTSNVVKPLWDVSVSSDNKNGDLRYMFPYMLVAASEYIDKNSEYSVKVSLDKDNPEVGLLRGIQ